MSSFFPSFCHFPKFSFSFWKSTTPTDTIISSSNNNNNGSGGSNGIGEDDVSLNSHYPWKLAVCGVFASFTVVKLAGIFFRKNYETQIYLACELQGRRIMTCLLQMHHRILLDESKKRENSIMIGKDSQLEDCVVVGLNTIGCESDTTNSNTPFIAVPKSILRDHHFMATLFELYCDASAAHHSNVGLIVDCWNLLVASVNCAGEEGEEKEGQDALLKETSECVAKTPTCTDEEQNDDEQEEQENELESGIEDYDEDFEDEIASAAAAGKETDSKFYARVTADLLRGEYRLNAMVSPWRRWRYEREKKQKQQLKETPPLYIAELLFSPSSSSSLKTNRANDGDDDDIDDENGSGSSPSPSAASPFSLFYSSSSYFSVAIRFIRKRMSLARFVSMTSVTVVFLPIIFAVLQSRSNGSNFYASSLYVSLLQIMERDAEGMYASSSSSSSSNSGKAAAVGFFMKHFMVPFSHVWRSSKQLVHDLLTGSIGSSMGLLLFVSAFQSVLYDVENVVDQYVTNEIVLSTHDELSSVLAKQDFVDMTEYRKTMETMRLVNRLRGTFRQLQNVSSDAALYFSAAMYSVFYPAAMASYAVTHAMQLRVQTHILASLEDVRHIMRTHHAIHGSKTWAEKDLEIVVVEEEGKGGNSLERQQRVRADYERLERLTSVDPWLLQRHTSAARRATQFTQGNNNKDNEREEEELLEERDVVPRVLLAVEAPPLSFTSSSGGAAAATSPALHSQQLNQPHIGLTLLFIALTSKYSTIGGGGGGGEATALVRLAATGTEWPEAPTPLARYVPETCESLVKWMSSMTNTKSDQWVDVEADVKFLRSVAIVMRQRVGARKTRPLMSTRSEAAASHPLLRGTPKPPNGSTTGGFVGTIHVTQQEVGDVIVPPPTSRDVIRDLFGANQQDARNALRLRGLMLEAAKCHEILLAGQTTDANAASKWSSSSSSEVQMISQASNLIHSAMDSTRDQLPGIVSQRVAALVHSTTYGRLDPLSQYAVQRAFVAVAPHHTEQYYDVSWRDIFSSPRYNWESHLSNDTNASAISGLRNAIETIRGVEQRLEENQRIDRPPRNTISKPPLPPPPPLPCDGGGPLSIEFVNVSFAHATLHSESPSPSTLPSSSPSLVLRNLSFKVERGEFVGIVGISGAGKTTLLQLIMRIYEPTSGHILINGVDISCYPARALRRSVSSVWQQQQQQQGNSSRFEGTLSVRCNLALGDLERKDVDAAIDASLHRAHATEILENRGGGGRGGQGRQEEEKADLLDDDYDDYDDCGGDDFFEPNAGRDHSDTNMKLNEAQFSGGELERLNLARGFMKADERRGLWLLDEATSAIDTTTEMHIQSALGIDRARHTKNTTKKENESEEEGGEDTKRATIICVAHRLSTLRHADRILVLSNGTIVESGTWDELTRSIDCDSENNNETMDSTASRPFMALFRAQQLPDEWKHAVEHISSSHPSTSNTAIIAAGAALKKIQKDSRLSENVRERARELLQHQLLLFTTASEE